MSPMEGVAQTSCRRVRPAAAVVPADRTPGGDDDSNRSASTPHRRFRTGPQPRPHRAPGLDRNLTTLAFRALDPGPACALHCKVGWRTVREGGTTAG